MKKTTDPEPPSVVMKGRQETELLRINFPGYTEDNLKVIDWDSWFNIFDEIRTGLSGRNERRRKK